MRRIEPRLLFQRRSRLVALAVVAVFVAWTPSSAAPAVYRDKIEANWSTEGSRFWYRNDGPGGRREFVLVDAASGKREPAFDHASVAGKLAELTGKRIIAASTLPIDRLEFTPNADELLLIARGGAVYLLNRRTNELKATEQTRRPVADGGDARALPRVRPSRAGGAESSLAFVNQTGQTIRLFWIDTAGERKPYDTLRPGQRHEQRTFANHVWIAVGEKDEVLGIFEASDQPTTATLKRPEPATKPTTKPANPEFRDDGESGVAWACTHARVFPGHADTGMSTCPCHPEESLAFPQVGGRPRRGEGERRPARGPRSPDGKWVLSFTDQDGDLRLRPAGGGDEIALDDSAVPGNGYAEARAWWSPDSAYVLAIKLESPTPRQVQIVESAPKDQFQPKVRTIIYPKPGDPIDHPRPRLFRIADRKLVPLDDKLFATPWSIRDVRWSADSSRVTFVYNQRGHQALRVIAIDPKTGGAKAIVDETSKTFIHYSEKYLCRWLSDDELIWMSERSGWNHLYLINAKTGDVKNPITKGDWLVRGVDRIDTERRQIWFHALGVRPGEDPYHTHFCRVNFDGSGFTILTEGDGTHEITWSPDRKFFIDRFSRVDLPPVHVLRRGESGEFLTVLEEADASEVLADRGGRWPIRFRAKGRDGKTDIWGVIWLPRDFDANRKYPVIESIYAGPQDFFTPKRFNARWGEKQRMADRGFIVVQCDGMGTDGRGKQFHDVCFKNLKDGGFPDRIAWIKSAAEKFPQMDLSRVGIYGGSAGGQNAMAALIWHHDFYKVAVADCGCHDNRMDKIWWNEQWMSWPVDESYAASSNRDNAKLMQGKLMLIVGEVDTNVDPASTLQVAGELQKAGKDFELVVVIGAGHGAAETPFGSKKRAEFLVRHLKQGGH